MDKIRCDNCQKEVDYSIIDIYNIKISNDTSYRYGSMSLCNKCSEECKVYITDPFYKSLMIIVDILKKRNRK